MLAIELEPNYVTTSKGPQKITTSFIVVFVQWPRL